MWQQRLVQVYQCVVMAMLTVGGIPVCLSCRTLKSTSSADDYPKHDSAVC